MKFGFKTLLAASALVAGLAVAGSAGAVTNLVTNGGFTTATIDPGSFTTLDSANPGQATAIDNWTISSGNLDYIGTYWQSADGDGRSLDLSGFDSNGTISQTVTTTAGVHYNLYFSYSANPDNSGRPRQGTALVNTNPTTISYYNPTNTSGNMIWQTGWVGFVGTGSDTISFGGDPNGNGSWGLALDNVSVSAIPEPATWAMMILGLCAVGGMARFGRRRSFMAV